MLSCRRLGKLDEGKRSRGSLSEGISGGCESQVEVNIYALCRNGLSPSPSPAASTPPTASPGWRSGGSWSIRATSIPAAPAPPSPPPSAAGAGPPAPAQGGVPLDHPGTLGHALGGSLHP